MSDKVSIQELLEAGLHHYGLGEMDKALTAWREVLRREPGNETAAEYIEIETGRRPEAEPIIDLADEFIEPLPEVAAELAEEFLTGQQLLNTGAPDQAIAVFEAAHRNAPDNPLYWAHVELSRARLIRDAIAMAGGLQRPIRLRAPLTDLIGTKDFTQEEGFVLSLITGDLGLEDLVALAPIPRFKTYEIVYKLLAEGLAMAGEELR
jgi:tetratricopeptide (TPR) repeat protein